MRPFCFGWLALGVLACSGEPLSQPNAPTSSAAPTASSASQFNPVAPEFRLPNRAVPKKISVTLTATPTQSTFSGRAEIDLDVRESTPVIWLHGAGLTVSEASIATSTDTVPARVVTKGEFLGFLSPLTIHAGAAKLTVVYTGSVEEGNDRGVFIEKDGEDAYLYTQFETTSARRAFPCFDEPQVKIPWQLTLRVKPTDKALSNTPVESETTDKDGWKVVRFAPTDPLPSYLVAFAIGPFDLIDAGTAGKKKVPVRFAVPKGHLSETGFSTGASTKILGMLEDTFGIPYPYQKLDYVVIPNLASFGAMENAGMITVGARYVVAKPADEDVTFKRRSVAFLAHESAHQWFGDLVTPEWWNDIWLNEGFATWMERHISQEFDPAFQADLNALTGASWVKGEDSLLSARKVRQEVLTEDDISNAFDGITYGKGAAVLTMFESWVGPTNFRKGVSQYLQKFAHKNANSNDFLTSLTEGTGRDVKAAMSTFLDQPGVPLITPTLTCKAGQAKLEVKQERYLPIGSKGSANDQTWQIPVCVHYGAGKVSRTTCSLLTDKRGEIALPPLDEKKPVCPEWVLPNAGGTGYYRSFYSVKDASTFFGKSSVSLPPSEALSALLDIRALTDDGRFPLGESLSLGVKLLKSDAPQLRGVAATMLALLRDDFVDPSVRGKAQAFVNKVAVPQVQAMGLVAKPKESADDRALRTQLTQMVSWLGSDKTLETEARALTDKWLKDPTSLDSDSVEGVLRLAAGSGDKPLFDKLLAAMRAEKDARRRHELVLSLSGFRDPELVKTSLNLFFDTSLDPRSTLDILWSQRYESRTLVWEFIKANFDKIVERMPSETRGYVATFGSEFCDETHRSEVETFFKDRVGKITGAPRMLAQTLEGISLCIAKRDVHKPSLTEFLKKQ
ncbi:MAG: M1 family metallopeptidase [Polyangiaceae bacterium]|nr:M1 family metallopeptidase [Polyangiaceae bacterium]